MERANETLSLLRRRDVERRTGLSRSGIYKLMAEGHFPRCVRITESAVGWVEGEIAEWIAERVRDSRAVTQ